MMEKMKLSIVNKKVKFTEKEETQYDSRKRRIDEELGKRTNIGDYSKLKVNN